MDTTKLRQILFSLIIFYWCFHKYLYFYKCDIFVCVSGLFASECVNVVLIMSYMKILSSPKFETIQKKNVSYVLSYTLVVYISENSDPPE